MNGNMSYQLKTANITLGLTVRGSWYSLIRSIIQKFAACDKNVHL